MSRLKLVRLEHVLPWPNDVANHVMRPSSSSGAAAASAVTYKSRDPCMDTALADKVSVWRGDITQLAVGAIVNAANETLLGGGGVDGAIHRAAGPQLRDECARLGGCAVGDAKVTGGHCLPASHVIHTVGPRGEQPHLLESCYRRCLEEASDLQLRSLAFPCIATGVYGYPNAAAARVALSTVRHYLEKYGADFDRIIFCLFLDVDVQVYQQLMHEFFPLPQK